jgi:ATP-dependent DNA ligase
MQNLENAIRCLENLGDTTKRNEKKALLASAAENPVLKEFFKRAYDWQTTYGLNYKEPKSLPKMAAAFGPNYDLAEEWSVFLTLLDELAARKLSGTDALETINRFIFAVHPDRAIWYARVLNRDLRVGVNVNTFGEVWPDLRSAFAVSLAEKFSSTTELTYPVAVEPKYDGLRITLVFQDGKGVGKTRSGKEYNEVLQHIMDELGPHVGTGAVDGEIYAEWATTGETAMYGGKRYKSPWGKTSAMLKTGYSDGVFKPERVSDDMMFELQRDLKFWAFDTMTLDVYDPAIGVDKTPFVERRAKLVSLVNKLPSNACTIIMPQDIASNREELDELHVTHMVNEHEGSMIKMLDAPYFPSRTAVMLKRKEEEFIDGVILEVLSGTGRNSDWAGSYKIRLSSGAETSCNVRGDKNRADHWARRDQLVGVRIEMTQQKDAKAVSQTARFPVFMRLRDDLPKEDV